VRHEFLTAHRGFPVRVGWTLDAVVGSVGQGAMQRRRLLSELSIVRFRHLHLPALRRRPAARVHEV